MDISIENGKYRYQMNEIGAKVLRYNEPWRDVTGDKFIYCMAAEIESLRQQLASVAKERDEMAAQARMLDRMVDEMDEQLAAALAACEAKDDALEKLIEHTLSCEYRLDEFHGLGNDSGSGCSIELCNASSALSIKPDASALKAHDDALIERVCCGRMEPLRRSL